MLIKLTGVPHPDLNGGKAQPVYIDASRVLLICQGHVTYPKIGAVERNRALYDDLYRGACTLAEKVNGYIPQMTDPVAVGWMKTANAAAVAVNEAYAAWGRAYNEGNYHPRVDCTEVQLACGTALEHGVMLTRVWISEPVDFVAELVAWRRGERMVPPEGYTGPQSFR